MEAFTRRFSLSQPNSSAALPERPVAAQADETVSTDIQPAKMPATFWQKWYNAGRQILPIYVAAHLAVILIDALAVLFTYTRPYQAFGSDYQQVGTPPLSVLWNAWNIWPHDTPHYIEIAQHGYDQPWLTVFFPLYPFLIRSAAFLTGNNYLIAALLVANLAGFVMLLVFYQLVKEDFSHLLATRAVLYFSIFPAAFFFMAGYTETTFLCFVLLSFYQMRRGRWWLSGLFGLLAALTRNTGIVLLLPFCYEYLRQHQFRLRSLRLDALSALLIPVGLGLFMLYCYVLFRDALAFQHYEARWHHILVAPWVGLAGPIRQAVHLHQLLSFATQRNAIELGATFFILLLLLLCCVGPWRFPRTHLAYILFAAVVWLIPLCSPLAPLSGTLPYQSLTRYMLGVFPAFIVLASLGKYRVVNYTYLMIAGALFFFLLTQFLLGYLIT